MSIPDELREAFRFHFQNSGYIVGECAASALRTARAELAMKKAIEKLEYRFKWIPDEHYDPGFWRDGTPEQDKRVNHEIQMLNDGNWMVYGLVLEKFIQMCEHCGCNAHWETVDSLWGIVTAGGDKDRRMFEADMALCAGFGKE